MSETISTPSPEPVAEPKPASPLTTTEQLTRLRELEAKIAADCKTELQAVLDKYNCYLDAEIGLVQNPNGRGKFIDGVAVVRIKRQ